MKKSIPLITILPVVLVMFIGWMLHISTISDGARLATENCGDCHDLSDKKKNEKGPYLWGIVNRRAASAPGFNYSEAFHRFAKSRQFSWSEPNLDLFITDPNRLIPGTKMAERDGKSKHAEAFEGIRERGNRKVLITYLRTLE
jgi:cytochrome c2